MMWMSHRTVREQRKKSREKSGGARASREWDWDTYVDEVGEAEGTKEMMNEVENRL